LGSVGEKDPWLELAKSDPSAWRKRGNPYTTKIAEMIAADAMLPLDGAVGKNVRSVAIACLEEVGDPEVVEEAIQDCRRKKANWRELSVWIMKFEIQFAGRRAKARSYFVGHLNDDPIAELATFECPKCHNQVYNSAVLTMDCLHHFESRADHYAWKGVEE
jgi:hypothetical protein